jgi:hypothetical protein
MNNSLLTTTGVGSTTATWTNSFSLTSSLTTTGSGVGSASTGSSIETKTSSTTTSDSGGVTTLVTLYRKKWLF